ncbi:MAG: ABC transporter permease [Chloroflexi bacterium]|nr:ABC transporter permease [Chloroflexota bacterium]MDA1147082.1 ABC transporter permease [Chloroflexota bacterium]
MNALVHPSIVLATARRVLQQIRRDRRTVALVLLVPVVLLALLKYVFDTQPQVFQRIGPPLVGLFPLILMFIITSIAMLRERTNGTLERLMSMPLAKLDLLLGYGLAFAVVASIQALVTALVAFGALGLETAGPVWLVILLAVANAILGMALGLLVSAFATSEFQAVQFMPAVLMPQFFVVGLFAPRDHMAAPLEAASNFLPLTYAYEALAKAAANDIDGRFWIDIGVGMGCVALALVFGALTLKRRTA